MKKKLLSVLLVGAMAFSLAACGGGGGSDDSGSGSGGDSGSDAGGSSGGDKLVVWTWDPAFNIPAIEEAGKIYKDTVNDKFELEVVETLSDDCETKLQTCAESGDFGTMPDIVLMQDNSYQKFVSFYPEAFTDLTDSGIDFSQFAEGKLSYSTVDGKNYGVPFDNGAVVSCYRTDILEEAGYSIDDITDIDWDKFIEIGKVVKEKTGKYMLSGQANSQDIIMMMLQSAGASLFNEDGTPNLVGNDPLNECIDIYQKMVKEGIFYEVNEWDEYVSSITNEQCAGTINGNWIMATIMGMEDTAGKWEITNMPKLVKTADATNYSNNGGSSWYVTSNCKNTDLAFDFLAKTFAGSEDLYANILPTTGAIGTWGPAGESEAYQAPQEFWNDQPIYSTIVEYAEKTPTNNTSAYYYDVREVISTAIQDIMTGGDKEKTLEQAQADAEFYYE
ncbi:carbohydrate ABC transporter substrate-binding protein [Lachnospiraceae bacterium WCA-9-b2]|jgi:lactose/L-arabinose transport system substrate-binding protein|uniref:Carbohydrate ABC transporter substrate-binding protein n=1 Tax=Sporofaciens musculi TaxID=2681861 RepID=A0A7X3SKG1_9FIRM|nr:extracellular solute-binding protein [Sporofaciens musculi]MXP77578.1 carbohydrate ABC transporter substrate-binding protein [Sporofaciens musculi]